jgi:4-amino-4-deoxy-L-arabinose transferase-like glycosyltransferase
MMLRINLLGLDIRLHPDEALYSAQARLVKHDWNLRATDLDKPPLPFYATALSFAGLGVSEFSARWPNVIWSSLSLAVLYALGWALYRDRGVAALAALLLALSPYDLAFAATVFTDVQATFWMLVVAWCAVGDRWVWAGVASALAFASKGNTLLFTPLIVALGLLRQAHDPKEMARRVGRWALALGLGIGAVYLWDLGRAPRSFLSLGYARYDPGRFVRANEVASRFEQWARWLTFWTGSRVVNGALLAGGGFWLARQAWDQRSRAAVADWLIAGFGVAFMAWHWLVAFNVYDRYIHTLTPFALLLAARVIVGIGRMTNTRLAGPVALGMIVVVLMLPATAAVLRGEAAIGGDQHRHDGIDALAEYLNTELRGETVYDHWLGWELAFYLGESPQIDSIYYPLPEMLADALAETDETRYFIAPSEPIAAPWITQFERAGVSVVIARLDLDHGFVIYRLN